jgi:hypothetical protein
MRHALVVLLRVVATSSECVLPTKDPLAYLCHSSTADKSDSRPVLKIVNRDQGAGFFASFTDVLNQLRWAEKMDLAAVIDFTNEHYGHLKKGQAAGDMWHEYFAPTMHHLLEAPACCSDQAIVVYREAAATENAYGPWVLNGQANACCGVLNAALFRGLHEDLIVNMTAIQNYSPVGGEQHLVFTAAWYGQYRRLGADAVRKFVRIRLPILQKLAK